MPSDDTHMAVDYTRHRFTLEVDAATRPCGPEAARNVLPRPPPGAGRCVVFAFADLLG